MKKYLRLWLPAAMLGLAGCAGGYGVSYYASTPPPPLQTEVYGVAPGPGYVWAGGYWGYNSGRYAWVPGSWQRPPHRGERWESARWEHHGNRYEFRKGHWR